MQGSSTHPKESNLGGIILGGVLPTLKVRYKGESIQKAQGTIPVSNAAADLVSA